MESEIIKTLCGMEVKIIPKQENIPDFDAKAIEIKHIDYYDPPYSSYEVDEITEEIISKILEEIFPEYAIENNMDYSIMPELVTDVVINALDQKRDAAPFPEMLCLCESSISDTMGMSYMEN